MCSCGSWNLTEIMLLSLEIENKGYCKSKCHSQKCGVYENKIQAVQVFANDQYELLIRNCDDLFLQPTLPYKEPPYPIKPISSEKNIYVRKTLLGMLSLYTSTSATNISQTRYYIYL